MKPLDCIGTTGHVGKHDFLEDPKFDRQERERLTTQLVDAYARSSLYGALLTIASKVDDERYSIDFDDFAKTVVDLGLARWGDEDEGVIVWLVPYAPAPQGDPPASLSGIVTPQEAHSESCAGVPVPEDAR